MNPIKICTVVTGNTLDEFVKNLEEIQKISELIELRVDYIQDLKIEDIYSIKKVVTKPAIITCRKLKEGGKFNQSEEKRIEIIRTALDLNFEYVDIEFSTLQNSKFEKKNGTNLIASYHDFEKTPPYWQLTKLIFDMRSCGADIIKVATTVITEYDVQVLFRVLLSKKPDDKQIILGMEERGKITRVLGPLLGSYLTYAAVDNMTTAPGQISLSELKIFYKNLPFKP